MDILLGWLSIFLWTRPNAYLQPGETFDASYIIEIHG